MRIEEQGQRVPLRHYEVYIQVRWILKYIRYENTEENISQIRATMASDLGHHYYFFLPLRRLNDDGRMIVGCHHHQDLVSCVR